MAEQALSVELDRLSLMHTAVGKFSMSLIFRSLKCKIRMLIPDTGFVSHEINSAVSNGIAYKM